MIHKLFSLSIALFALLALAIGIYLCLSQTAVNGIVHLAIGIVSLVLAVINFYDNY